jgi:arginine/ornithine transport system substrate-binding protein
MPFSPGEPMIRLPFFSGLMAAAILLTGCQDEQGSALEERAVTTPKVVRVATEGAYPPFNYLDETGTLTGMEVELTYALCAQMQVECQIIAQDWDALIPGLLARKYDAIIASMSISDARRQSVSFSESYYVSPGRFVGALPDMAELSLDDLPGKVVAVQKGTVNARYLEEKFGDTIRIRHYGKDVEAFADLMNGRVDLWMADALVIPETLVQAGAGARFGMVGPNVYDPAIHGEGIGVAMRPDDRALKQAFDKAIADIRASGVFDEIAGRYFDFDIKGE